MVRATLDSLNKVQFVICSHESCKTHALYNYETEDKALYCKTHKLKDMENIKIAEGTTESAFQRNSFIYDFMSSMRQKVNDPLGVRAKKRKEISQR